MKVIRFVATADPNPSPRLGAPAPKGKVVDLQAAHFAMTGAPHPALRDPEGLLANGAGPDLVRKVADWALTQDAPGTTVPEERVRVLESWDL
jgi:hypothetical protein